MRCSGSGVSSARRIAYWERGSQSMRSRRAIVPATSPTASRGPRLYLGQRVSRSQRTAWASRSGEPRDAQAGGSHTGRRYTRTGCPSPCSASCLAISAPRREGSRHKRAGAQRTIQALATARSTATTIRATAGTHGLRRPHGPSSIQNTPQSKAVWSSPPSRSRNAPAVSSGPKVASGSTPASQPTHHGRIARAAAANPTLSVPSTSRAPRSPGCRPANARSQPRAASTLMASAATTSSLAG